MITKNNQLESYLKTDRNTRYKEILRALTKPMTARQLAYKMNFYDLNAVKPRLTEMHSKGWIKAVGKHFDQITERTVTVWERVNAAM